jgi:hypothetical protein
VYYVISVNFVGSHVGHMYFSLTLGSRTRGCSTTDTVEIWAEIWYTLYRLLYNIYSNESAHTKIMAFFIMTIILTHSGPSSCCTYRHV